MKLMKMTPLKGTGSSRNGVETKGWSSCLFICSLLVGFLTGNLCAQTAEGSEVNAGVWEVEWLPKGSENAPIGTWAPASGFWLDEIPWVVWEAEVSDFPLGMERLVDSEAWVEILPEDLTSRQRQLLMQKETQSEWNHVVNDDFVSIQFQSPLFRFDSLREVFERLIRVEWAVGAAVTASLRQTREREWPADGPLERSNLFRLSIATNGIYRIDRSWMLAAGLNPDTLDPRRVRIWGNGGEMLPMENSDVRPLGVELSAIYFEGEDDGLWDTDDALYFFGDRKSVV